MAVVEEPVPVGTPDRSVLIVTEDEELLDDLLRLCAAAGAEAEVAHGGPPGGGNRDADAGWAAARAWERAALVLVGDDRPHEACDGRPRRSGVLLVGRDLDGPDVWQRCARIGAEGVVALPDAEHWLAGRIADASEGTGPPAMTVGVLGGRGGAGASTLSCALAVTAARTGARTVLVDGDPLGGGLDVLFGGEDVRGLRWPAFAESRGRVAGEALEEALPRLSDVHVLSWDRERDGDRGVISPDAVAAVLGAARRRGGVVVVDLPRGTDGATAEALVRLDLALLVVPAELRAVAAADRVAARNRPAVSDLRVVVRPPGGPGASRSWSSDLGAGDVARLLGLELAGELPWEGGVQEAVERGAPPGSSPDGALAVFCRGLWERILPGAALGARPRARGVAA